MTQNEINFSYVKNEIPQDYSCSNCGKHGIKLWRQYQTFACNIDLLCCDYDARNQKKKCKFSEDGKHFDKEVEMSIDQIGWLVPAVSTEENDTFWGYTSVPQDGVNWWKSLPLRK